MSNNHLTNKEKKARIRETQTINCMIANKQAIEDRDIARKKWQSLIRKLSSQNMSATRIYITYSLRISKELHVDRLHVKDMIERATGEKINMPRQENQIKKDEEYEIGE